jgi:2-haloacid dehalogenase
VARWASFDCYGTLIDWNAGIRGELARVFGEGEADAKLERYHELEPGLEHDGRLSYREVMTEAMRQLGASDVDAPALADSLPGWQPFPEVRGALEELRRRGWRLGILTNSDRDLIEASKRLIGVPFEETVVASEIHSYKPAHKHWREFADLSCADPARYVHVAQSHFHDIVPATELGIPNVWINRLAERREPAPTRELADLTSLPDVLDELVPEA